MTILKLSIETDIPKPTIAEVLFRSGYLENWGSGAKRIIDLCKEHGIPEPIWVDNHGFISICFFKSNKAYAQNVLKEISQLFRNLEYCTEKVDAKTVNG